MIAIIDYGMGNLRSVQKALERIGAEAMVTSNATDIQEAEKIILPGVGAMRPAMERLNELGLVEAIKAIPKTKKPFLGICLGLQLLFDVGREGGEVKGLGILSGDVSRFMEKNVKVPHMGWNQLRLNRKSCPLWQDIPDNARVYFCHSYFVNPRESGITVALTEYGCNFVSAIQKGNIYGVQFHPEKSQSVGLKILENFVKLK